MAGGPILCKVAGAVLKGAAGAISKGLGVAGRAIQKATKSLKKSKSPTPTAGKTGNFSRKLTPSDLGVKGTLTELKGTFSVKDGVAVVRVDMIEGKIKNPFQIISNLIKVAKASGAKSLRIEGTLGNDQLLRVLSRRYELTSKGATETITIPLKR